MEKTNFFDLHPPVSVINSKLGKVFFYEDFVVSQFNEGITLSYKNGLPLLMKGLKIVGTKPFFYISYRKYSYSLVPTDYKFLGKIPNLKALAIVYPRSRRIQSVGYEGLFLEKPMQEFSNFQEAYVWGKEMLLK